MPVNRKRGGQPGNQNARTHGRYARILTPREQNVISALQRLDAHGRKVMLGYLKVAIGFDESREPPPQRKTGRKSLSF